uniref:exonuclease mut-7 homolog n=1 Tax=Myxine glutinosa TaxID=7769 RepID=UPI00358FCF42
MTLVQISVPTSRSREVWVPLNTCCTRSTEKNPLMMLHGMHISFLDPYLALTWSGGLLSQRWSNHASHCCRFAHCQAVYLIDMLALTSQDEAAIVVGPSGTTGHLASEIQGAVTSDCTVPHDFRAEKMESGKDKPSMASPLLTFLQRIFSSTDVLKLGYSLSGDLKNLTRAYPFLAPALKNLERLLDLELLHKQLLDLGLSLEIPSSTFDGSLQAENWEYDLATEPSCPSLKTRSVCRADERGLSSLVCQTLGWPLDKRQQLSNWEQRPLTTAQKAYAAADAYCLLEVYKSLMEKAASAGLNMNVELCKLGQKSTKTLKNDNSITHKKTVSGDRCQEKPPQVPGPLSSVPESKLPKDMAVVCDNMLQGLGRYLRCLGIDVRIMENEEDHRAAAEYARAEGRIILTCGLPFQTLRSQVGEGRCMLVDCTEKAREQAKRVLQHYNVYVTPADIFSRCQCCNGNHYMKMTNKDMARAIRRRAEIASAEGLEQNAHYTQESSSLLPQSCPQADADDGSHAVTGRTHKLRYAPVCSFDGRDFDEDSLYFGNGTRLQVEKVPQQLPDQVDLFFCCSSCGKVFWEGSHFSRLISQFEDVLQMGSDSFYGCSKAMN